MQREFIIRNRVLSGVLAISGILLLSTCAGDEEEPDVSASLSVTEIREGSTSSIVLNASGAKDGTPFVYSVEEGQAKFGDDVVELTSASGTITDGKAELDVTIINDDFFELRENFDIRLSLLEREYVFPLTITNDDDPDEALSDDEGFYTPESYGSMELVWQDEFDGETLSTDYWTYELGNGCDKGICGWGNNELQNYTDEAENVKVSAGKLTITATERTGGYYSARLITQDKIELQYGRIDARAKMPKGQGLWPAIWMLGANIDEVNWPACGEIDIMELVGHEPEVTHGTVHYDNGSGYTSTTGQKSLLQGDFSDQFHVYSIVWDRNQIQWYLDYQLFKTFKRGENETYPFNSPFYFIINVAVGGNWPGDPDESTVFPQEMVVDYIRVFQ